MTNKEQEIKRLTDLIDSLEKRNADIEQEIDTLEDEISDLKSDISDNESEIYNAEAKIERLNALDDIPYNDVYIPNPNQLKLL